MHTLSKESLITAYFSMWVKRDFTLLANLFAEDIYYSECYGPEYHGLPEIYLWIKEMLQKQKVLAWEIKRFIHATDAVVVEWFFKEEQGCIQHAFDGVSIIEFDAGNKITVVKEFQSKAQHIAPYRGKTGQASIQSKE